MTVTAITLEQPRLNQRSPFILGSQGLLSLEGGRRLRQHVAMCPELLHREVSRSGSREARHVVGSFERGSTAGALKFNRAGRIRVPRSLPRHESLRHLLCSGPTGRAGCGAARRGETETIKNARRIRDRMGRDGIFATQRDRTESFIRAPLHFVARPTRPRSEKPGRSRSRLPRRTSS